MSESAQEQELERLPENVDPADAFALLGNELRIEILRALWAASDRPLAFSELHRAVDVDDSAHFNYHLEKLTDHFVHRVDEGYDLGQAGEKVVRAVLAGSFTQHPYRTIDVGDPCTQCGNLLVATYADETLSIECTNCGHGHGEYPFPPGGLNDRTDAEVLTAFDQRVRHLHCLANDGVCPECAGRTTTTIESDGECCLGVDLRADHVCGQCDHTLCSAVGLGLLDHSAVVAFYEDHGIDLGATPYWRLEWCVSAECVDVRSADPWRIDVEIELEDDALRVTLDGELSILETSRDSA